MLEINFRLIKSNEIDRQTFSDISECFRSAFQESMDYNYFKWKYIDNPVGASYHLLAYINDKACLSRNFWRVHHNENLLQCVDTAVHGDYQGMGLFKKSITYMDENYPRMRYYNYPNPLSIKQYLKYGWDVKNDNSIRVHSVSKLLKLCGELHWNKEQVKWRYERNPKQKYSVQRIGDKRYLFGYRKSKYPVLLGFTRFSVNLPKSKHFLCFTYDENPGLNTGKHAKYISRNTDLNMQYYMFDMS